MAEPDRGPGGAARRPAAAAAPAAHPTILIIDDHAANLQVLTDFLIDQRFRILVARDGQSGIEKAAYARPDLILLDVNLPDIDGFTVCRTLKAAPALQQIPVIFITAHVADMEHKLEGFAAGAVDYLSKPIQQQELLARVSVHMRLQALTQRLQQQAAALQREVDERALVEVELQRYKAELEERVAARTAELAQANIQIQDAYQRLGQLHEDLARDRDLLQTLFDGLDSGLALLDGEDRVLLANQHLRDFLGSSQEPLEGQHWPGLAPYAESLVAAVRQSGAGSRMRRTVTRNGQPSQTLDITVLPLPHAGERVERVLLHQIDVSEQAQLAAMALQNERFAASGRLAASVAHEVNSPLQAIQNFLFIVGTAGEGERQHFLRLISEEILRIGHILRRLMNVQQAGDDRRQPLDCQEVIERVLLLASGRLANQRIRVERAFSPGLPPMDGRPDYLTQMMLNLVLNAADAMAQGGVLRIATASDGERISIAVEDNGQGIDPELLDQIFEPFFTTKAEGNGIGLAVTRHLVEELAGTIAVESAPGQGTRFTLRFPIARRGAASERNREQH